MSNLTQGQTSTTTSMMDASQIMAAIAAAVSAAISDIVYGVGWDGVAAIAPSKNAVYDKIQTLLSIPSYLEKTADYVMSAADGTVNCTAGTFQITLPTAVGLTGLSRNVKNSGSGLITVIGTSSQTIDGQLSLTLTPSSNLQVQSNGANWIIL